jgi:hypothetical protein
MKTIFIAIAIVFVGFSTSSHSANVDEVIDIKRIGRTALNINIVKEEKLRLEIITVAAVRPDAKDENAYLQSLGTLFGREEVPDTVISGIRVKWYGIADYMISSSASADLYSPNRASLKRKGKRVVLKIVGGDGSSGYEAEIELAPYGVLARRVFHRTSGYVEKTDYQHTPKRIRYFNEQLGAASKP